MARILVADPDDYTCETIAMCLERCGHEVLRAEHGDAAMTAILQNAPHLVMCEIMLPMRSGFELLASLQGLGLAQSVPVMFVTANASQREMDRAIAEGVSDYVVKPFHLRELTTRVSLALTRRDALFAAEERPRPEPGRGPGLALVAA